MDRVLDELSSGALSPEEAFTALREFLAEHKGREASEHAYEAVRGVVWQLVSSREGGDHILKWQNTVLKVKQLLRRSDEKIAERFVVLADFLGQSARFRQIHAPHEMRQRKHVMEILAMLVAARAPVDRATIGTHTKLKTANLSRVLSNLAAEGLVQRRYHGRDVEVKITEEGRRVYSEFTQPLAEPKARQPRVTTFTDQISNFWPRDICSAAVSSEAGLIFWHDEFLDVFADQRNADPKAWDINSLRSSVAQAAESFDDLISGEVSTPDGRAFRVTERPTPDHRSIWLSMDVTAYRRRLDSYERRERQLKMELDVLKRRVDGVADPEQFAAEDPLNLLPTIRRDLLTPANAIYHAASTLQETELSTTSWQAAEKVTDIVNFSKKLRDFARTFVKMGEASTHPLLHLDHFTPDEVLQRVLQNLAITLRHSDVVVRQTGKVKRAVVGDEIAMEAALTTTLVGIVACLSMTSVLVKQKLTSKTLQFDVFCPVPDRDLEASEAMAASMHSSEAAIKQMGLDFYFNSSSQGYNASIVAPFKAAVAQDVPSHA